jgi:pimeloyl-ACP methyl ester carboxylesterase
VKAEHVANIIPSTPAERSAIWHRSRAVSNESRGVDLRDLPLSCVALQGSHDLLVPASTLSRLAGALPVGSRTQLIRGAGHVPYLTHLDECVRYLRPWIASISAGSSREVAA